MQTSIYNNYLPSDNIILEDGAIPLTWWSVAPNFGDLLSPFLVSRITSKPVKFVHLRPGSRVKYDYLKLRKKNFSYLAVGSIIRRANSKSVVWGSGAFGTEGKDCLNDKATYLAVRGPLTRNLLRINGIHCPEVFGDPALLLPGYFYPQVKKKYKIGIILRWSEKEWNNLVPDDSIKKIFLGTDNIEGTISDILSCERIISSSLHGVILADAYGIPSAWLGSTTPKGLEFKFYDYFISVNKVRKPQTIDFSSGRISIDNLNNNLQFDDRQIDFNPAPLLDACPFLQPA